jgi:hypothetical protein
LKARLFSVLHHPIAARQSAKHVGGIRQALLGVGLGDVVEVQRGMARIYSQEAWELAMPRRRDPDARI